MTAREAAREEWRKLKDKPLKDKLVHIGTYYWPHILVGGFLLVLAVSTIVTVVTKKDPALQGYFLSTTQREDAAVDLSQAFSEYAGIDTEKYDVTLTPSSFAVSGSTDMGIADSQIIMSQTAAGALDILCCDVGTVLDYAYSEYFRDLREVLTPAQLEAWEDNLLYIDQTVLDTINEGMELEYTLPDPAAPEQMENPVPVALCIPESSGLWDSFTFLSQSPAIGIIINSQHPETAVQFLEYILP